mmetsp:Transcript_24492/g.79126  ORF Transcript_24492/g.79126 Transcript_24492/m.79126 type:complete len:164 (-) Transcript_24492:731-1222(-)
MGSHCLASNHTHLLPHFQKFSLLTSQCVCWHNSLIVARKANPTIGASFLQKRVCVPAKGAGHYSVSLQLWDTAGQERFRSMAPMYYRGATAAIIVFDVTKERSWEKIDTWHKDLLQYAEPGVAIGIAGNKIDLPPAAGFNYEACQFSCAQLGASFHLTSAVTG